ncbi:MAG: 2-polyprenyl-6-methoxyphenol hydroxylase-like FAD-dependent oxidoreductase [Woeseiaceae bacterium]|jgi:2-polyprenyl-6-methoxyphenol hydroxylase-like FAD-dependent oxidoreductase
MEPKRVRETTRAIVLGASIAGLLAGRILASFFDEVILLDKEELDDGIAARKAVPQGNHVHVILTPTYVALQRYFPGLVDNLVSQGATVRDAGSDARVMIYGQSLTNGYTGQAIIGSTRPFFENHLRQYVLAIDGVEIRSGHRFQKWLWSDSGRKITGIVARDAHGEQSLSADLFVDARGRASTLISELNEMGYGRPPVEQVEVGLGYTSRLYRTTDFRPDWNFLYVNPYAPGMWKGGIIAGVEDDKWVVTQFGYFNDHPPADEAGFMQFARSLDAPDVADFLSSAQPASAFCRIGMRDCKIFRFEKLDAFPERLLAVGDTVCSLNPVYGQGMTKAANEAVYLRRSLEEHMLKNLTLDGFSNKFRRGLPDAGANWGWQLTRAADLSFRKAIGNRSAVDALMVRYMKRLLLRATNNLDARSGIMDATMLIKPPQTLLRPGMIMHAFGK